MSSQFLSKASMFLAKASPLRHGARRVLSSSTPRTLSSAVSTSDTSKPLAAVDDDQLLRMIENKQVSVHRLEDELDDHSRAVDVRRQHLTRQLWSEGRNSQEAPLSALPRIGQDFDADAFYSSVHGTNCESVIGFLPVPVGVVGPLDLDGTTVRVPMATTEGALLASTNRGCRAITVSGGVKSFVLLNGMTRAPLLRFPSLAEAAKVQNWVSKAENAKLLTDAFNSTSNFGRLQSVRAHIAGKNLYLRFACFTGDAMGMNMVTKGSMAALEVLCEEFPQAKLIALSGNICSDKKSAAVNWIEGRGRSVAAEAVIKADVVENMLHTTVDDIVQLNVNKNYIGSALAGALGGFNAHASNIVSAIYLATGNDIAQNIESSMCLTQLEKDDNADLHFSVTMPAIELGTVGGGTSLPAQAACLDIMGVKGSSKTEPGANADRLSRIVAGTVMAGELSLLAALASNDLLSSHLRLNRKKGATPAAPPSPAAASTPPRRSLSTTLRAVSPSPTYPAQLFSPRLLPTTLTSVRDMSSAMSSMEIASAFGHPSSGGPACQPSTFVASTSAVRSASTATSAPSLPKIPPRFSAGELHYVQSGAPSTQQHPASHEPPRHHMHTNTIFPDLNYTAPCPPTTLLAPNCTADVEDEYELGFNPKCF